MPVQEALSESALNDETLHELGLTEQPFLENKSRQRVIDSTTQKTRAALEQHVRFGDSLHLLIGDEGAGKTVLLQQLLKHCKNNVKPFVAKGSDSFRAEAFLYAVLNDLNKEAQAETIDEYIEILGPIFQQVSEDGLSALMIIDDAHLAPIEEVAELVDILQHFESEDGKTARLLLTGTPALQQSIARIESQVEDLNLNYSTNVVEPLDNARTREYLTSRLNNAGFANTFPFTDKAITKIQNDSSGLPGKINQKAAQYLNGVYRGAPVKRENAGWLASIEWPVLLVGAAAVGAIGIGLTMFFGNDPEPDTVIPVAANDAIEQPVVATTSVTETAPNTEQQTNNDSLLTAPSTTAIEATNTNRTVDNALDTTTDLVEETTTAVITPTETTITTEEFAQTTQTQPDQPSLVLDETDTRLTETFEQAPNPTEQAPLEQAPLDQVTETLSSSDITVPRPADDEDIAASKSVGASDIVNRSTTVDSTANTDFADTTAPTELGAAINDINTSTADNAASAFDDDTDAASTAPQNEELPLAATIPVTDPTIEAPENTDTVDLERAIENERWVLFQSPLKFTVQLATSREREYIIDLARTMNVEDPVAIYPFLTTNSNNPVFGLLSGLYETRSEAISAVEQMDDATKKFGVWIRPVSDLQAAIKRRQ